MSNSITMADALQRMSVKEQEDFGVMLLDAVRYAMPRQSYMPSIVISYIRPLLPYLTTKTLFFIMRDIKASSEKPGCLGAPQIDEPDWLRFLTEVTEEYEKREKRNGYDY